MKKVLIIGARGHIGSFLVNRFVNAGWEVTALSRTEKQPYAFNREIWQNVRSVFMPRGQYIEGEYLEKERFDAVCDLVCYTPAECSDIVNKLSHGEFYLQLGSIWTYENKQYLPVDENHPKNSAESYGREKGLVEDMVLSLCEGGKLRGAVVHPGHISSGEWMPINPQGNLDKVVYDKIRRGEKVLLPFLGLPTLQHVHAEDLAEVIAACVEQPEKANGQAFISAAESAMTMRAITENLFAYFGHEPNIGYVSWEKLEREIGKENAAVTMDHVSHSPCATPAKALRVLGVKHKHGILDIYKEYYNGAYLR